MLYELLPLLEGWKIYSRDVETEVVVNPGKTYELAKATDPGWIVGMQVSIVGPPDTQFVLEYYDPLEGYRYATVSPAGLLALGFDMPNPASMYLATYDPDANFYCIAFTPAQPFPFFASRSRPARITVKAPETSPTVVKGYAQSVILVADIDMFRRSLAKVLGAGVPETIREELRKFRIGGEDAEVSRLAEEVKKLREVGERIAERLSPEGLIERLRRPPWEVVR